MRLRHIDRRGARNSAPRGELGVIDAGLRAYTRSFAIPLIPVAVIGVMLVVAAWLAELA